MTRTHGRNDKNFRVQARWGSGVVYQNVQIGGK